MFIMPYGNDDECNHIGDIFVQLSTCMVLQVRGIKTFVRYLEVKMMKSKMII